MSGQSPLSMMHEAPQHAQRPRKRAPPRRHPLRLFLTVLAIAIVVALGWTWGWYYAASIADRALSGWVAREAALGRVYACGSQNIGGFPFSIVTDCNTAAATFNSNQPPFDVRATGVTFSAEVYRPTLLHGEVAGPVTLADPGQPPVFVANWSRAQIRLLGMPPAEPERATITLHQPRFDRVAGPGAGTIFRADLARVDGQIVQGSARDHPVIEVTARFEAAIAPLVHPLLATPLTADIDVVMRGFKDFSPKPWPVLFRDMQAEGGGIEIVSFRIERTDAIVVGTGRLSLNTDGRRRRREYRAAPGHRPDDRTRGRPAHRRQRLFGSRLEHARPAVARTGRRRARADQFERHRHHQKNGRADRDRQEAGHRAAAARQRRRGFRRHHSRRRAAGVVLRQSLPGATPSPRRPRRGEGK
jgi:hypothetical protein